MTLIAIVILNWNGKHHLEKFLPSVCRYSASPGNRIIVVDNGSTDDSVTFVRNAFPEVELITFQQNLGFAPGYHKALKLIEARYFVLLNSDVEVTGGWLEPLYKAMETDPELGACMPKMLDYQTRNHFEYAGAAGGFIDRLGYPFCRGRLLSNVEKDTGQYDTEKSIFWASGACMFVRAAAYISAGELDVDFFAHMEEIDLCWRMKRTGYTIRAIPRSVVYHIGGGTLPNNNPRKLFLNYRNNLFLLFKNLPNGQIFPLLLTRMILDGFSAIVYLFTGSPGFFMAVLKAHMAFYRSVPGLMRKRAGMHGLVDRSSLREIYPHSILWEFFIRGKRSFGQLKW